MAHPVIDSRVYTGSATGTLTEWETAEDGELINYVTDTRVLGLVEAWHNDVHPGVFRFCDEQPCHAIAHDDLP